MRFGKLTVIDEAPKKNGHLYWLCICDCGVKKIARSDNLRNCRTRTCGSCGGEDKKIFFRDENEEFEYKKKIFNIWTYQLNNRNQEQVDPDWWEDRPKRNMHSKGFVTFFNYMKIFDKNKAVNLKSRVEFYKFDKDFFIWDQNALLGGYVLFVQKKNIL